MGRDFYKILNVERGVDEDALKKAYKKGAMKWHPDRNPDNKETAERKFKEISEAYQVLSDPKKKEIYDRFGEDGLKSGMENGPGGGAGGFHAHFGGGPGFRPPEDLFRDLFGGAAFGGPGGGHPFGGGHSSFSHMFNTGGPRRAMRKQPDTEVNLNLELEDLYRGVTKKLKITRNVLQADGTTDREDKIHEVVIKAGYKAGTKIRYTGAGGESPGYAPADVVFIINEKPHNRFKRNRDNLEITHKVTLADALAGAVVKVEGLDGRAYQLDCKSEVITPNTVKTISGAGMPISKRPGHKGDLVIKFDLSFPSYIAPEKKQKLRDLLS